MKVRWSRQALADLDAIHAWLSGIEGAKPDETVLRIRDAASLMERLGDIGRPSRASGARELSVRTAPYVVVYRVEGDAIDILAVFHTSQDR